MKKILLLILAAGITALLYACGSDPKLKEIDRGMEEISRRLDRMSTVVGNLNSKEIKEQKELFDWHMEEFESQLKRLKTEYDDVKATDKDGNFDAKEVKDVIDIAGTMKSDADKFLGKTDEVIKMLDVAGPKDMKEECLKLKEETVKFSDEINRLNDSFARLIKPADTETGKQEDNMKTESGNQ